MVITAIKRCRSCDSDKIPLVMSFGNQYVTNFVNTKEEQGKEFL